MDMTPAKILFQAGTGDDEWTVEGLRVRDQLGEPYRMRVALRTDDASAEPSQLLGRSVSVVIERGSLHQELGGIVESLVEGEHDGHDLHVQVTVVPALVALSHRRTSRIFQDMTIPEVLGQVLGEGLGPYERSVDASGLQATYPAQEYTVQYRETDFDFAHRLMEENGITYRFATEGGVETMLLGDGETPSGDLRSHGNADGVLPVTPVDGDPGLHEDAQLFERTSSLQPTVARTAVFDWHVPKPLQDGENAAGIGLSSPNGATLGPEREDYDHIEPSTLYGHRSTALDFAHVQRQLELRRAVHQRDAVRCTGRGTATQMAPGVSFELLDHPQAELSGDYVVVGVEHLQGIFAGSSADSAYRNEFECLPKAVPWRPHRQRLRPRIAGMQTATVVGPGGEEIHTDEHGRIKIQLHWDRGGQYGADASCFVRVVQPWAGNGWGTMFLPRIGMEVAVTFLDGDPDRPIVTGCLYNGANPPPYGPGSKSMSGLKSSSTPGGGGSNELRFEDGAGGEQIYLHAQKDMVEEIGNDHTVTIANDQTQSVGNNQTLDVAVDQTQTIGANQIETIGANQTLDVGAGQSITVKADQTLSVLGSQTVTVTGAVTHTMNGGLTCTINAGATCTINGGLTATVSGGLTATVNGSTTTSLHGSLTQTVDGACTITTVGGLNITSPAGVTITAPGGMTVVDPSTTREAHGIVETLTGVKTSLDGTTIGATATSISATGVSISATGISISATGLSISATDTSMSSTNLDFSYGSLSMLLSALSMDLTSLKMIM